MTLTSSRWITEARCLDADPDVFFPESGEPTSTALAICETCPVREPCARWGIDNEDEGIWGATTPGDRHAIREGRITLERVWNRNRQTCRLCGDPVKARGLCGFHYRRHLDGRRVDAPRQKRRRAVHGTRSKYTAGCRCDQCRDAESDYQRARYRRERQAS